jgi:hypothetical protein
MFGQLRAALPGTAIAERERMRPFVAPLALAAVLAAPSVARAQPGMWAPPPPPAEVADERSPVAAGGLALLGTAAGWGAFLASAGSGDGDLALLGLGGVFIGPSLGHFYAGEWGGGFAHMGVRAAAGGVVVLGAVVLFTNCYGESDDCDEGVGTAMMLGGAALGVGSTIYSIVDAPRAARRVNERRRLALTPAPMLGPDRSLGYGLQLGASF